jgi:hypothetical protein
VSLVKALTTQTLGIINIKVSFWKKSENKRSK